MLSRRADTLPHSKSLVVRNRKKTGSFHACFGTRPITGIHSLAREGKIDFDSTWSHQDPSIVAKILRVSAGRHPYLTAKRFPRHWATSSILQRFINSVRAYTSGKANPTSGANRRRQKVTKVGRAEAQRARRRRVNRVVTSLPLKDQAGTDLENASIPISPGSEEHDDHNVSPAMNPEHSDEDDESEEERLALEHRESSSELESDLSKIPMAQD
ncbi:hypothetical protein C8F04DRAFT_1181549 [Mycena alexandri]|uniref:Uncharacterized protein n=1 Tax=Mycena alexandri TaxID=1745969 RepID=A0AAD6SYQ8_9AGAR|nr:hypothetical protein C8F04DRAFT_1181549 [Mycena alexandri]